MLLGVRVDDGVVAKNLPGVIKVGSQVLLKQRVVQSRGGEELVVWRYRGQTGGIIEGKEWWR